MDLSALNLFFNAVFLIVYYLHEQLLSGNKSILEIINLNIMNLSVGDD